METCTWCKARWFDMKLKDGICHNCVLKDRGGQTLYLFSAENKMDPGIVLAYLLALTQIEEMVIAWSHVQIMIKRCCDIPLLKGLVAGLPLIGGRAPGYKSMGRSHIHDSKNITIINTINLNLMSKCSACKS